MNMENAAQHPMNQWVRRRPALGIPGKTLAAASGFTAFAAVGGAAAALPEAKNPQAILQPLQALPLADALFGDLTWPRAILIGVVAIPQALTLASVLFRWKPSRVIAVLAGTVLLAWMALGAALYGVGSEVTGIPVMVIFSACALAEIGVALWKPKGKVRRGYARA
ncbi:MAG: hypothetical protein LBR21_00330 [Propionibacteriaceae bacterium]|jgi:hypothetical protein|nr:hypothetical protein [Propionibacteriaceae bacterium]